jgi:hypothetical protein
MIARIPATAMPILPPSVRPPLDGVKCESEEGAGVVIFTRVELNTEPSKERVVFGSAGC